MLKSRALLVLDPTAVLEIEPRPLRDVDGEDGGAKSLLLCAMKTKSYKIFTENRFGEISKDAQATETTHANITHVHDATIPSTTNTMDQATSLK